MPNSAISFNTSGLASASSPGLVGTGAQTFAGKKTLDGGALIKGDTSGVAISAGYVGEKVSATQSAGVTASTTGSTFTDLTGATINLTPGVWFITANFSCFAPTVSANSPGQRGVIRDAANNEISSIFMAGGQTGSSPGEVCAGTTSVVVNISVATTYKLSTNWTSLGGTPSVSAGAFFFQSTINAFRIA